MKKREIIVKSYWNKNKEFAPIITLGFKENTHLGMSGYLFELSPDEAREVINKLRKELD